MKNTFRAKTFAAKTFAAATLAGQVDAGGTLVVCVVAMGWFAGAPKLDQFAGGEVQSTFTGAATLDTGCCPSGECSES